MLPFTFTFHLGRVKSASPMKLAMSRLEAPKGRRSRASFLETFTQFYLHRERSSTFALIVIAHVFIWSPVRLCHERGGQKKVPDQLTIGANSTEPFLLTDMLSEAFECSLNASNERRRTSHIYECSLAFCETLVTHVNTTLKRMKFTNPIMARKRFRLSKPHVSIVWSPWARGAVDSECTKRENNVTLLWLSSHKWQRIGRIWWKNWQFSRS